MVKRRKRPLTLLTEDRRRRWGREAKKAGKTSRAKVFPLSPETFVRNQVEEEDRPLVVTFYPGAYYHIDGPILDSIQEIGSTYVHIRTRPHDLGSYPIQQPYL